MTFFFLTSSEPYQFLVGQLTKVLPGVAGLLWRRQSGPVERLLVKTKIDSSGGNVSGHRFVGQLFDYALELRDTSSLSIVVDVDEGFRLSDQFMVEV